MASNYDNSARFYDKLSRLVYGRSLVDAQVYLLPHISPNATILIIGGGTGWILEEITRQYSSGLQITYVEISANMVALSRKRNVGNNQVIYINDAIENVQFPNSFDVIITPFLFDNFKQDDLKTVFKHIHSLLKAGSLWLCTDFQHTGKWWQSILLKSMFLFFKLLCKIDSSKLPNVDVCFEAYVYKIKAQKTFFNGFIVSRVYQQ